MRRRKRERERKIERENFLLSKREQVFEKGNRFLKKEFSLLFQELIEAQKVKCRK